jgi:AraC-like DNA-binding protein
VDLTIPPEASAAALPRIINHALPSRLLPFIERAFTVDYSSAIGARWRVLPSGSFGIRVILDKPEHDYELVSFERHCVLSGVPSKAFEWNCQRACVVLAVSLTPLAAAHLPLEGHPLDAWSDAPARAFMQHSTAERLRRQLADAPTLETKVQTYLAWLEGLLFGMSPTHGRKSAIAEAAERIRQGDGMSIVDMARRVGVTRRQLERDFRRFFGTSPKSYLQVISLQRMAQLAWRGESLAAIAAELEFADQSHMTHSVRLMTGLTPAALLTRAAKSPLAHATRAWWGGRITVL